MSGSLLVLIGLGGCLGWTASIRSNSTSNTASASTSEKAAPGASAEDEKTLDNEARRDISPSMNAYLKAVHAQIHRRWVNGMIINGMDLLPPEHPVNTPGLMVEVELRLDEKGQIASRRLIRGSGCAAFDNAALRVMSWLRALPSLPAELGEGHPVLRWRFHRDKRACSLAYAQLEVLPLSLEEKMQRALARGEMEQALAMVQHGKANPSLFHMITLVGLRESDPAVKRLALELAPLGQLSSFLEGPDEQLWNTALQVLSRRKMAGQLIRSLTKMCPPPPPWRAREAGHCRWPTERTLAVLRALDELQARLPPTLQKNLLHSPRADVLFATAALVHEPQVLDEVRARWRIAPTVTGPLAVRQLALSGTQDHLARVRDALAGPGKVATLQALSTYPQKALLAELETLVQDHSTPTAVRLAAISAMATLYDPPSVIPLYVALNAKNPEVQIAAARALSTMKSNKLGTSYRLAGVAYTARGRVAAETLAALALVGDERFRPDTLRRIWLLDAEGKAIVARALWSYGEASLPTLHRLAQEKHESLLQAVSDSLRRIPGSPARQMLASLPLTKHLDEPQSPLKELLQQAIALSKSSTRDPAQVFEKNSFATHEQP